MKHKLINDFPAKQYKNDGWVLGQEYEESHILHHFGATGLHVWFKPVKEKEAVLRLHIAKPGDDPNDTLARHELEFNHTFDILNDLLERICELEEKRG